MIITSIAFLLLVMFLTPIVYLRRKKAELFSPIIIVSAMHIITIVPFLLLIAYNPEYMSTQVLNHFSVKDLELSIVYYAFIQAVAYISLLLGLITKSAGKLSALLPSIDIPKSGILLKLSITISFLIGLVSFLIYLRDIGGYSTLLNNLEQRTQLASGKSYLTSLLWFLNVSTLLFIYSLKRKASIFKKLFVLVSVFLNIVILSSMGGRTDTIFLIISCLLVWHYRVSEIKKVPLKAILLILFLAIYVVVIPIIRMPGAFEYYVNNMSNLPKEMIDNSQRLITNISSVNTYVLITSYFNLDNIWLGKSYLDLLVAPIPSSLYPNKPPIDEGVYIYTIASGYNVEPGMSYSTLAQSAWPPETLGTMYSNFWIPGVMIGMYLLGFIYQIFYSYLLKTNYSFFSIACYGVIIIKFHLSNIRIVQTIYDLGLLALFCSFFSALYVINKSKKDIREKLETIN